MKFNTDVLVVIILASSQLAEGAVLTQEKPKQSRMLRSRSNGGSHFLCGDQLSQKYCVTGKQDCIVDHVTNQPSCPCKKGRAGPSCLDDVDECSVAYPCPGEDGVSSFCVNKFPEEGLYKCGCLSGYSAVLPTNWTDELIPVEWRPENCVLTPTPINPTPEPSAQPIVAPEPPTRRPTPRFSCTTSSDCQGILNNNYECNADNSCVCKSGFMRLAANCQDIQECKQTPYPCHKYADCTNTIGSYECRCMDGYEDVPGFNTIGTDCRQVNECAEGLDDCPADKICIDLTPPAKWKCIDPTPAPTPVPPPSCPAPADVVAFSQPVTPAVIFGAGNDNGAYTTSTGKNIQLGLRGKLRFNSNSGCAAANLFNNVFNTNTYTFPLGDCNGNNRPVWSFEWSINSDIGCDSATTTTCKVLADYDYLLVLDEDPSPAIDPISFDPIRYIIAPDHSLGTASTPANDMSCPNTCASRSRCFVATDANGCLGLSYAVAIQRLTVAQNSWQPKWFIPGINHLIAGTYTIRLSALTKGTQCVVASTTIDIRVGSP